MKHEIEKIKDLAHKFNVILSGQQKLYGGMILICTIFAAFMETLGISAILPIIEGLMTPEGLENKWYLRPFVSIFYIQETPLKSCPYAPFQIQQTSESPDCAAPHCTLLSIPRQTPARHEYTAAL